MANTLEYIMRMQTGAFTGPLNKAKQGVAGLNQGVKSLDSSKVDKMGGSFGALALKIGAAVSAIGAAAGVFAGFKKSVNLAADMESTQVAFKTLIGNADLAAETLKKLKKFGAETPLEFPDIANAARMLIAFGESAGTVTDTLKMVGDISSGVGAGIGEIAEIYGKARVAGTLFAEDINQLLGRGIPVIKQFAKQLGVSEGEVKKLASEGKVTFPMLEKAFKSLTSAGGQFHGMMAQQSTTTKGLISTLKDNVNDLFMTMGQPINDALKPILEDAIGLAGKMQPMFASLGQTIAPALQGMRDFIAHAEQGGSIITALGTKLKEAFMGLADIAMVPFRVMGAALPGVGSTLMNILTPVGVWLMAKFEQVALGFGQLLMRQMSAVMAQMPRALVGDAPLKLGLASVEAGQASKMAGQQASNVESAMSGYMKAAGNELAGGISDVKAKLNEEMARFSMQSAERDDEAERKRAADAASRIVQEGRPGKEAPLTSGGFTSQIMDYYKRQAGGLKAPISNPFESAPNAAAVADTAGTGAPAKAAATAQIKAKAAAAFDLSPILPDGGSEDTKIRGYSRERQGGADAARARAAMRGNRTRQAAEATRSQFGNLGYTPQGPKGLAAPGTAKRDQERREGAATAARGDRARWDLVQQIEGHLRNLAVG